MERRNGEKRERLQLSAVGCCPEITIDDDAFVSFFQFRTPLSFILDAAGLFLSVEHVESPMKEELQHLVVTSDVGSYSACGLEAVGIAKRFPSIVRPVTIEIPYLER